MADKSEDGPSLEMPSFSLRRRRASGPTDDNAPQPPSAADEPVTGPEPATPEPPTPEPPTPEPAAPEPAAPVAAAPAAAAPAPAPAEATRRREPRQIAIGGLPAAALTGLLVGGLAVLVAWLSGTACEAVRGTSSCGGAAGLPILLATLVLLAYVGALLLGVLGVDEPGSTSLLAVGVLAVLVMVFLLGSLDEWWALVAVPVTSVVAYVASWWVTTVVVGEETEAETPVSHDVR